MIQALRQHARGSAATLSPLYHCWYAVYDCIVRLVIMSINLLIIFDMVAFGHRSAQESQIAQWKLSRHRRHHDLLLGTCIVAVSEVFGALGLMCQGGVCSFGS